MLNGLCKLHYFCLWKKTSKRCVFNKILKCWYFVSRRKYREANRVSSCANVSEFCDVICGQRKHIHIYIHTHPMSVAWWNQSHTHWKLKHSRADYTQMTYNIPSVCVLHLVKIIRRPKPTETIPQDRQVPLVFLPPHVCTLINANLLWFTAIRPICIRPRPRNSIKGQSSQSVKNDYAVKERLLNAGPSVNAAPVLPPRIGRHYFSPNPTASLTRLRLRIRFGMALLSSSIRNNCTFTRDVG